jgi:hypothetical protein
LAHRSGTKNVTVVSNLENFGIPITDDLRREIAKRFSVSVRYGTLARRGGLSIFGGFDTQDDASLLTHAAHRRAQTNPSARSCWCRYVVDMHGPSTAEHLMA